MDSFNGWKEQKNFSSISLKEALKNNLINEAKYQQWASQYYKLPILQSKYFIDNPNIDIQFWNKIKNQSFWNSSLIPLFEWENTLYIACLKPQSDLHKMYKDKKIVFLIADTQNMESFWLSQKSNIKEKADDDNSVLKMAEAPQSEQKPNIKEKADDNSSVLKMENAPQSEQKPNIKEKADDNSSVLKMENAPQSEQKPNIKEKADDSNSVLKMENAPQSEQKPNIKEKDTPENSNMNPESDFQIIESTPSQEENEIDFIIEKQSLFLWIKQCLSYISFFIIDAFVPRKKPTKNRSTKQKSIGKKFKEKKFEETYHTKDFEKEEPVKKEPVKEEPVKEEFIKKKKNENFLFSFFELGEESSKRTVPKTKNKNQQTFQKTEIIPLDKENSQKKEENFQNIKEDDNSSVLKMENAPQSTQKPNIKEKADDDNAVLKMENAPQSGQKLNIKEKADDSSSVLKMENAPQSGQKPNIKEKADDSNAVLKEDPQSEQKLNIKDVSSKIEEKSKTMEKEKKSTEDKLIKEKKIFEIKKEIQNTFSQENFKQSDEKENAKNTLNIEESIKKESVKKSTTLEGTLGEISEYFDSYILFICKNKNFTPYKWSTDLNPKKKNSISTDKPSLFRICYQTKQPYCGHAPPILTHNAFFENWNFASFPKNITLIPLIHKDIIIGGYLGISKEKDISINFLHTFQNKIKPLTTYFQDGSILKQVS